MVKGENQGQSRLIVTETIQSLPIPDHVPAHDQDFFMRALEKLPTLINKAPVKQVHRNEVKRRSTESIDTRPAKAQKPSRAEKAYSFNLSVK